MVLSSVTGLGTGVQAVDTPKVENSSYKVVKEISNEEVARLMSTEQYVRQYFQDIPIMIEIARCESTFRQLDSDGEIHRGVQNPLDVGVMQINEHYHLDTSEKKAFNIYTLEGNTAYARYLYETKGTQPWSASKPCWGKYVNKDLALNSSK